MFRQPVFQPRLNPPQRRSTSDKSPDLIYSYDTWNMSKSEAQKLEINNNNMHERQNSKVTVFDDNLEEHFQRSLNIHNNQKSDNKIQASVKSEPTSPGLKNSKKSIKIEKTENSPNSTGNAPSTHSRQSSWNRRNLPNSFFNKPKNNGPPLNLSLHSRSQSFDPDHIKTSSPLQKQKSAPTRRKKQESKKSSLNNKSSHTRIISAPVEMKNNAEINNNLNIISPNFGSEFSSTSNISIAEEQTSTTQTKTSGPIRGNENNNNKITRKGHQRSKSGVISSSYSQKQTRVHRRENSQPYSVEPHAHSNHTSETGSNIGSNMGSPLNSITRNNNGSRELLDLKFDNLKFEKFDPNMRMQQQQQNDMNNHPIQDQIHQNNHQFQQEPDSTGLPDGWQMMWDPRTSRMFFIDHNTKRTTWNDPRIQVFDNNNSMDTGYDNNTHGGSFQNNATNLSFSQNNLHQPQTSFDSQATGNLSNNSLMSMDMSRNASQEPTNNNHMFPESNNNNNFNGSSNSLNKPLTRPSNLGFGAKYHQNNPNYHHNHNNSSFLNDQSNNNFDNNNFAPPNLPPPNLTVTLPSQQLPSNTSYNTHPQQYRNLRKIILVIYSRCRKK